MSGKEYASISVEDILTELHTSEEGLSAAEAKKRLESSGHNELKGESVFWYQILFRQFTSPFLYLLVAAGVLSFFLGEKIDGIMIFFFVLINSLLGFYQEYRSEQTLKLLKNYIQRTSKVLRDGKETQVDTAEVVPGDIVLFEAGDIIPADVKMLVENDLTLDESILTGESAPVRKFHDAKDKESLAYSGTTVVSGEGRGVVILTGRSTAIGKITKLTVDTHRESSFEKSIRKFSKFILYLIILTLIGIFFINIIIKGGTISIPNLLIFSIALAVSVIPEALPIVITFSLSRGALQLAKHKVVVKRLSAIEDLGSIEVLCTDKTGTLTENQLTLHSVYTKQDDVLLHAALASTLRIKKTQSVHSFDISLLDSLSATDKKEYESYKKIKELPFDPIRKRSSMVVEKNNKKEIIVRGASEIILHLCKDLTEHDKKEIKNWIEKESGNRVIAIAKKELKSLEKDLGQEESNLEFVGLVSFVDPIKKTAYEAVDKAKRLGIKIIILTGDSKEVAGTVAEEIKLIQDKSKVITGDEFDAFPAHKQHQKVNEYSVFARVSPEQKYKIIQLLQLKNEVGFLGEGINDAPALKIANVAIVVSGATDVAREASDIILLKKSLHVIVDGIKEGRETFANTSKYIRATLSSNFGNFYTVATASLFINFLPLLPLQLLLINLLTDFPMLAVATDSVDEEELSSPRTYDIKDIALIGTFLGIVSSFFDFLFFATFYKVSPSVLQTNWFIGSVLTELLFLFSIRSRLPIWQAKTPSGTLIIFTSIAFITALVLPFTAIGHHIFSLITPSTTQLTETLLIVTAYIFVTEAVKLLYYRFTASKTS